jgi:ankyrin repeat protein
MLQNEKTPLHRAATMGHQQVVGLLLGAGAAVDAVNMVSLAAPRH